MSILEIIGILLLAAFAGDIAYRFEKKRLRDTTVMSIRESLDLVGLPIVTFTIDSVRYNFILDTGANISTIDSSIIPSIKHEKTGEKDVLYGIDGRPTESEYLNIDLEYNNNKYTELFQAADIAASLDRVKQESGISVAGLIGNSFFQKYKYLIDFNSLKVYSKK